MFSVNATAPGPAPVSRPKPPSKAEVCLAEMHTISLICLYLQHDFVADVKACNVLLRESLLKVPLSYYHTRGNTKPLRCV